MCKEYGGGICIENVTTCTYSYHKGLHENHDTAKSFDQRVSVAYIYSVVFYNAIFGVRRNRPCYKWI